MLGAFVSGRRGVVAVLAAAFLGISALATGAAIDITALAALRADLKRAADAGALAAARAAGSPAGAAAETMFDTVISGGGHRLDTLERSYSLDGEEHVLTARAEMKSLVLGVMGKRVLAAAAESAAVSGTGTPEGSTAAPCIHVGARQNAPALTMEAGTRISGADCVLVLEHDSPDLVSVDGAALDIAGFCVNRGGAPARIEALAARLRLPYLPEACDVIGAAAEAPAWGCDSLVDEEVPLFDGIGGESRFNSGSYCGFVRVKGQGRDVQLTGNSEYLEAREGDMFIHARSLTMPSATLIVSQSLPDLHITVQEPSLIRAPTTGPYAGIAILLKTTAFNESIINLNGPITVEGAIIAPGLTLALNGGEGGTQREMEPLRAAHLKLVRGADILFHPYPVTEVEVTATAPRLVR